MPFFVSAAALGESQVFFINPKYDFSGRSSISVTLRLVGEKAEYFIEDEYWNSRTAPEQTEITNALAKLSNEFDRRIYPIETEFWGSEWNPGIDNNQRVVILLHNLVDTAGGYFDTSNEHTKTRVPESNEKEIIFLNIRALKNERKMFSFLAHEFQHLISFYQKNILRGVNDDIWLNELRSEYAVTMLGYNDPYENSNLKKRAKTFVEEPADSLTEWQNLEADYGQVTIFAEYLTEHFGSQILRSALQSSKDGIESLNEALAQSGHSLKFSDIFLKWAAANALQDTSSDLNYGYFREGLRQDIKVGATRTVQDLAESGSVFLTEAFRDWQAKWLWVTGLRLGEKNVLKIGLEGDKLNFFKIAVIVFNQNGSKEVKFFNLAEPKNLSLFFDIAGGVEKIIFIPVKMEKRAGFTDKEELSNLTLRFERVSEAPFVLLMPDLESVKPAAKPADFGLKEGDFIRAEGDNDIYIINDFGYKRLVLSPKICLQYGHLGKRGCFSAVKIVTPAVRDAFKTSQLYTNGETNDGKIYYLETTGEDTAFLRHLNISGADFKSQGGIFSSVFLFNNLEQQSYSLGSQLTKLPGSI